MGRRTERGSGGADGRRPGGATAGGGAAGPAADESDLRHGRWSGCCWRRSTRRSCRRRCRRSWATWAGRGICRGWCRRTCWPNTIATVLAGKFGDQFGRKLLFQVSAAACSWSPRRCAGWPPRMTWLIGWRAVQGFGGRPAGGDGDGGDRRRHPAARARQVPGRARRGLRRDHGARAAARRAAHRPPLVAVDLLHQPADRHRGDRARGLHDARSIKPRRSARRSTTSASSSCRSAPRG